MEYDLTDYSFYLEAERDEQFRQALEQEAHEQSVDSVLLEMEIMQMLEMI